MNLSKKINVCFAVLWMLFLLSWVGLFVSSKVFGWPAFHNDALLEKRTLTARPDYRALPAKKWGGATEKWYNDNFAWRSDIITFYRDLHFKYFKSPVKGSVPGVGNWVFGRGGVWPEVEDYMGAIKMDDAMIADWETLFEGRVAWCEAHGCRYLQVITSMKAHVHPEKMLPMITLHKKESYRDDLRREMASSFACTNVLFLIDALSAEVAAGHEVYYEEDHHENAYGCYCIYREMNRRMRELWYPELPDFPYYEDPVPQDVRDGKAAGCWVNDERRLVVSNPGTELVAWPALHIVARDPHYPQCRLFVRQPGEERFAIIAHDSFLRYPFSTWYDRADPSKFALPVGAGFDRLAMMIFTRLTTERMEGYVSKEVPDVLIEQFSEGRLQFGPVGLDETMRRASAWGRGTPVDAQSVQGGKPMVMAVFENVTVGKGATATAELRDAAGAVLATVPLSAGVRRAVFFGEVEINGEVTAVAAGCTGELVHIEFRSGLHK